MGCAITPRLLTIYNSIPHLLHGNARRVKAFAMSSKHAKSKTQAPLQYREFPTWALLLHGDLPPASVAHMLLGRVVADFEHPTLQGVPKLPNDISQIKDSDHIPKALEVVDKDGEIFLNDVKDKNVELELGRLLNVKSQDAKTRAQELRTKKIITITLQQAWDIFDEIKKDHNVDLVELVKKTEDELGFMVVGLKICIDADVAGVIAKWDKFKATANIPAGQMAAEAFSSAAGAPGLGSATASDSGNISFSKSTLELQQFLATSTMLGKRIFAAQYLQVRSKKRWSFLPRPKPVQSVETGVLAQFPSSKGLFHGGNVQGEELEVDDAEGELNEDKSAQEDEFDDGDLMMRGDQLDNTFRTKNAWIIHGI